jgi:hypothetical protein
MTGLSSSFLSASVSEFNGVLFQVREYPGKNQLALFVHDADLGFSVNMVEKVALDFFEIPPLIGGHGYNIDVHLTPLSQSFHRGFE